MAKNKQQKQEILRNLEEKLKKSKSVVFTGFNALTVKEGELLRSKLREEHSEYYVAKKTLMNLAFKDQLAGTDLRTLDGQLAAIFSYEDEVAPAKVVASFKKDKELADKVVFLGGILENKLISQAEVEALSLLPSRPELYAKVVGSLNAPVSGLVNVLAANLRNLVYVLKAIEESKS
ncbi:MAG: 50S ribosomal protein L10 [Patescibacteria group bacterium]|jgi:large subunit ribosomal protein L10